MLNFFFYLLILLVITKGKLAVLNKLKSDDSIVTANLYILSFIGIILTIATGNNY